MALSSFPAWAFFAFLALVFWGASGITQKLSTNRISSELSFLLFVCAMILISAFLIARVTIDWHAPANLIVLAAIGGTLNGGGVLTSFLALETGGKASIVIALISLFPLPTVAYAVLVLNERLALPQVAGIILAIVAAILLSQEPAASNAAPVAKKIG